MATRAGIKAAIKAKLIANKAYTDAGDSDTAMEELSEVIAEVIADTIEDVFGAYTVTSSAVPALTSPAGPVAGTIAITNTYSPVIIS